MLSFERLLSETDFVPAMRELCQTLQRAYNYPVDIEFTANFAPDGRFRINLVQCRPFQVKIGGDGSRVEAAGRHRRPSGSSSNPTVRSSATASRP